MAERKREKWLNPQVKKLKIFLLFRFYLYLCTRNQNSKNYEL